MHCDLQALYDDIASATWLSKTAEDVDLFHDVSCASDFVFIDAQGSITIGANAHQ